jgi:hypothetical protein
MIAETDNLGNLKPKADSKFVFGVNAAGDRMYIGRPTIINGQPYNKAIVIDVRSGEVIDEPVDLGEIQYDETKYIQNRLSPGVDKGAKGYENKDIRYK